MNDFKCSDNNQFLTKLHQIGQQNEPYEPADIANISEFLRINDTFLNAADPASIVELNSIAAKVKSVATNSPLISKIRSCTEKILPADTTHIKDSVKQIRSVGFNQGVKIADWASLMDIPLDSLDLSQIELLDILFKTKELADIPRSTIPWNSIEEATRRIQQFPPELKAFCSNIIIALAKSYAKHNVRATAENFRTFRIEDPAAREEFATLCAKIDGKSTAAHIENFEIQNPETLDRIAIQCVRQNGWGTARFIHNFKIPDVRLRYQLFLECVLQDQRIYSHIKEFYPLPQNLIILSDLFQKIESNREDQNLRNHLFAEISTFMDSVNLAPEHKVQVKEAFDKIVALPAHAQGTSTFWLVYTLVLMDRAGSEAIDWMLKNGLWKELGELRQPKLRIDLTPELFSLSGIESERKEWDEFLASVKERKGLRLLAISFSELQKLGLPTNYLKNIVNNIGKLRIRRDVQKMQMLAQLTHLLAVTPLLTVEQKVKAVAKIFPANAKDKKIMQNAAAAKGLLYLNESSWIDSKLDISASFRLCFERMIPLDTFEGDASLKYDEIFANSRNPGALLRYAAGLSSLDDATLIPCLSRFVVSVFSETFKEMRYETKGNPHLTKIFEARPDLQARWQADFKPDTAIMSTESQNKEEFFDVRDFVNTKLVVDKHLENEDLSFLKAYLRARTDEDGMDVVSKLSEEIKKLTKEKKKLELEKDAAFLNLKLQMACIKLAMVGATKPLIALEKNFQEINQILKTKNNESEFAHEIRDLLEFIDRSKQKKTGQTRLQLFVTDDPIDLLLSGTDVAGSCQRVDGDPHLNKGLLGVLMDGKNRLAVIKDEKGIIVARTILRILWDGEQPVLLRERFYPATISEKQKEALKTLTKEYAEHLGLPLTASDRNSEFSYERPLEALGGPAPWEYSDASGGVRKDGRYIVKRVNLVE